MIAGVRDVAGSAQSLRRLVVAILAALLLAVSLSPALAHKGKKDGQQQAQQTQNVSGQAGMGTMRSMMGNQPMGKRSRYWKPSTALSFPELGQHLDDGRIEISVVADMTDQQLDSVPPPKSSRFSDGRRSLEMVVEEIIAHQAQRLTDLKTAVAE